MSRLLLECPCLQHGARSNGSAPQQQPLTRSLATVTQVKRGSTAPASTSRAAGDATSRGNASCLARIEHAPTSCQLQPHNRTVAIAHALTRFFTCIDGHAHEHLGLSARLWHVGDDGVEFGAALDQLRATRATPE